MEEHLQSQEGHLESRPDYLTEFSLFEEDNYKNFEVELKDNLTVTMSLNEQVTQIVLAALRVEFGPGFHRSSALVKILKEAILNDTEKQEAVSLMVRKMLKPKKGKKRKPIN